VSVTVCPVLSVEANLLKFKFFLAAWLRYVKAVLSIVLVPDAPYSSVNPLFAPMLC
jgi:hypothetical protein